MNLKELLNAGYIYLYRGDKMTLSELKMQPCIPVLQSNGKCIRGKNGNMLVSFNSGNNIVLARQLRRIDKLILKEN
jgi:hypothetical protein